MRFFVAMLGIVAAARAVAQAPPLEEVVVTADFRERGAAQLATAVTVLDAGRLEQAGVQHFEDVLLVVPNLNWSGETSRPRFLQIRGIGEREQYQGAPNPSVGFIVDDIDFSGIGMVATLFDVEQIEVLRGPQGTRYGANALAGLVNLTTRAPSDEFEMRARVDLGSDNLTGAGIVLGGPLADTQASYRVVVQSFASDGFRDNEYLGRTDTNARDELTTRAKLSWPVGDTLDLDLTAMHVDLANGYDAWANDNGFVTRSDDPGEDSQRSDAFALRARWSAGSSVDLLSITTFADSDIVVSFDGDWGNDAYWGVPYDYTSATGRERRTWSQELRWLSQPGAELFSGSTTWLAGLYWLSLEETNAIVEQYNGDVFRELNARFAADNVAAFGQLDTDLGDGLTLSYGLRVERREADYADSDAVAFAPAETMAGGHVSLTRALRDELSWYGSLVRGYKAGGFNIGPSIPADRRQFDPESLWSLETGIKGAGLGGRLDGSIGIFYSARRDQQVSTSLQLDPSDPLSFVFFTDNAAEGYNYGVEAEGVWRVSRNWTLDGSLGLLRTRYDRFDSPTVALAGREQAHAPNYQFALGAAYRAASGWYARFDVQGRDAFFFDDSHNERSEPYTLVHMLVGYAFADWDLSLWIRNAFDETYAVRGFYFANDPNDPLQLPQLFTRLGDPRQTGVTMNYRF